MALGARIRGLREKTNLTQKALAEKLNIPHQNLSNYERGFRQPDYDTLIKIADFFEVTTDYLLRDEPPEIKKKVFEDEALKILEDPDTLIAAADGKITDSILKAAQKIIAQQLEIGRKPGDIRNNKYKPDKPTDES
ncbi:helix-turn-helix domain-containing protein [Bacillus sp. YC2]|uniref:helix-turn-helix domain-containing protein n=1 Tax=Bacillus sp. YC2 TaxID=2861287 RepID=UPI001CA641A8|nr:helix-turn-helix transcriptional regulator [Bacillus sp. YC2]MBY8913257.1 helix-turn-helix domain-containing protein [Bacillus sp. YC2]